MFYATAPHIFYVIFNLILKYINLRKLDKHSLRLKNVKKTLNSS